MKIENFSSSASNKREKKTCSIWEFYSNPNTQAGISIAIYLRHLPVKISWDQVSQLKNVLAILTHTHPDIDLRATFDDWNKIFIFLSHHRCGFSIDEAARYLNVSRRYIFRLLKSGRLISKKIRGARIINSKSILSYKFSKENIPSQTHEREKQILWRLMFATPDVQNLIPFPTFKEGCDFRINQLWKKLPCVVIDIPDNLNKLLDKYSASEIRILQAEIALWKKHFKYMDSITDDDTQKAKNKIHSFLGKLFLKYEKAYLSEHPHVNNISEIPKDDYNEFLKKKNWPLPTWKRVIWEITPDRYRCANCNSPWNVTTVRSNPTASGDYYEKRCQRCHCTITPITEKEAKDCAKKYLTYYEGEGLQLSQSEIEHLQIYYKKDISRGEDNSHKQIADVLQRKSKHVWRTINSIKKRHRNYPEVRRHLYKWTLNSFAFNVHLLHILFPTATKKLFDKFPIIEDIPADTSEDNSAINSNNMLPPDDIGIEDIGEYYYPDEMLILQNKAYEFNMDLVSLVTHIRSKKIDVENLASMSLDEFQNIKEKNPN